MRVTQPRKPITNVCFKTYGYMSMSQAIAFLSDFKLGLQKDPSKINVPSSGMFSALYELISCLSV